MTSKKKTPKELVKGHSYRGYEKLHGKTVEEVRRVVHIRDTTVLYMVEGKVTRYNEISIKRFMKWAQEDLGYWIGLEEI